MLQKLSLFFADLLQFMPEKVVALIVPFLTYGLFIIIWVLLVMSTGVIAKKLFENSAVTTTLIAIMALVGGLLVFLELGRTFKTPCDTAETSMSDEECERVSDAYALNEMRFGGIVQFVEFESFSIGIANVRNNGEEKRDLFAITPSRILLDDGLSVPLGVIAPAATLRCLSIGSRANASLVEPIEVVSSCMESGANSCSGSELGRRVVVEWATAPTLLYARCDYGRLRVSYQFDTLGHFVGVRDPAN